MTNMYHPLDARLEHRAIGAAALTATTTIATVTGRAAQRTPYRTLLNIESIKISANDEAYTFVVEVSNDDFTTVEVAAELTLGATEVRTGGAPDNAAGDNYEMLWTTQVNNAGYQDWRLRMIAAGTSPSIGFSAFSSVLGDV